MKDIKTINLPCECVGGSKMCGFLRITNFFNNTFELNWVKNSNAKRAKIGIYLKDRGMDRLKKLIKEQ